MSEEYPFINRPLPYAYNALEPYIDTETMRLHHNAHLKTYIDNLNAILENYPSLQHRTLEQLINQPLLRRLPNNARIELEHNAGGVYNHRLFFESLAPAAMLQPENQLAEALVEEFGSHDRFRLNFDEAAESVFGSGYAWLGVNRRGNLAIVTSANQEVPPNICPILNLDVWEHAYYLKHANCRVDYIPDWWSVVNWPVVEERYHNCIDSGS